MGYHYHLMDAHPGMSLHQQYHQFKDKRVCQLVYSPTISSTWSDEHLILLTATSKGNDEGTAADQIKIEMDQRVLKELEISMQMEYSFKLSRSLTALTYFSKDCYLISGSFGMVLYIILSLHNFSHY